jgi:hypothetical protein
MSRPSRPYGRNNRHKNSLRKVKFIKLLLCNSYHPILTLSPVVLITTICTLLSGNHNRYSGCISFLPLSFFQFGFWVEEDWISQLGLHPDTTTVATCLWITNKCTDFLAVYYFCYAAPTCFDTYVSSSGSSSVPAELHANRMQRLIRPCVIRGYVSVMWRPGMQRSVWLCCQMRTHLAT